MPTTTVVSMNPYTAGYMALSSTSIATSLWDRSDFYIKLAFGSLYFSRSVKRVHRAIRNAIMVGDGKEAHRVFPLIGDAFALGRARFALMRPAPHIGLRQRRLGL